MALCCLHVVLAKFTRDPLDPLKEGLQSGETYGTPYNFTQMLDHFKTQNGLTKIFNQRYWVNDTFYQAGGPVVLYICGEWTCSAANPELNPAFKFGADNHGLLISLEHRYYGQSQPFTNAEGGWSYNNLKYLNTTQALADTALFIEAYKEMMGANSTDNWLIVGGSYPGAFVAWFKHLYPDHVKAAWSSSGVIDTKVDFTEYDLDLYHSNKKSLAFDFDNGVV